MPRVRAEENWRGVDSRNYACGMVADPGERNRSQAWGAMMRKLMSMLLLLLVASPSPAAEIRKCKDPVSGTVTYTDQVCPTRTAQEHLEIHDNRVGALPPGVVQPLSTHDAARPPPAASPKPPAPAPTTSSTGTSSMSRSHY
jgi:hypothetical protein